MSFYLNNDMIPNNDRGLTLGDGVFDSFLIKNSKAMFMNEHIDRLIKHASILKIKNIPPKSEIISQINNVIKQINPAKKYSLRTTITRGVGARGIRPPEIENPNIIIKLIEITAEIPPAKLWICQSTRRNEFSPTSKIKTTNYADNIIALNEAIENKCNEALILNTKDNVACISSGNIYIIENKKIITPPLNDGVMDGITRSKLIDKYNIAEETINIDRLYKSDYIFTSNSIAIRPVIELNGNSITPPDLSFINIG